MKLNDLDLSEIISLCKSEFVSIFIFLLFYFQEYFRSGDKFQIKNIRILSCYYT